MKFITGLLMFSSAGSFVSNIDKNNYRQNLCDSELFRPTPFHEMVNTGQPNGWEMDEVSNHYQLYCSTKANYEQSIEDTKNSRVFGSASYPCAGEDPKKWMTRDACTQQNGILYAQSCEQLKEDKKNKKKVWNTVVPTLESCNNSRRRR